MDFARARDLMVESQVRPNDVTDMRILHAMRTLPRERFVPPQRRSLAYADMEVEVADGRTLMRPRDLSKLVMALDPQAHERARIRKEHPSPVIRCLPLVCGACGLLQVHLLQ